MMLTAYAVGVNPHSIGSEVESFMKDIAVIGVGYVGLVTATCFADLGNRVVAMDVAEEKIDKLHQGVMPIYEPGLAEVVQRNVDAGRLHFTTSYADTIKNARF